MTMALGQNTDQSYYQDIISNGTTSIVPIKKLANMTSKPPNYVQDASCTIHARFQLRCMGDWAVGATHISDYYHSRRALRLRTR